MMQNESDADPSSVQADVLSGILLSKKTLLLMFDALSPSILNIDVFCPFFYPFCPV